MTTHSEVVPAGSIVVGIDGSPHAERALEWAAAEAAIEHRPLVLAHGTGPGSGSVWASSAGLTQASFLHDLRVAGRALLVSAHKRIIASWPELEVHEALREGDPRTVLLELSDEAATVVVGSRGRGGIRSLLLGSVGVAVTKHATCPVVVLRPVRTDGERNGVLVGVDSTDLALDVLEFAYRIAAIRDLPLTVAHGYWNPTGLVQGMPPVLSSDVEREDSRLMLAELVAGMAEKFPEVKVRTELVHGLPDDFLVRGSQVMDLVVVGAHQGGPLSYFTRGSVASSVVEHAGCPVAVVPASV